MADTDPRLPSNSIAVVGMSGRFPGARSIDELWRNLVAGVESITRFTDEELRASGISPSLIENPDYVKARGLIDGPELFDAAFFGISHREAELMDPQQRLFLETCWLALEHAGIAPSTFSGPIGVWGGMSTGMTNNTYLLSNLHSQPGLLEAEDVLPAMLGNENDYLTTRVLVQAAPARSERQRAVGVFDVAGRDRAGRPGAADVAVRRGAGRRRVGLVSAARRLSVPGGRHRLARRPLPRVRRAGPGHRLQQRRRRRRAAPARRRAGRSSADLRGDSRRGDQQRRLRESEFRRAERRRTGRRDRHGARDRRRAAGQHRLRRSARHGHAAGRSDRSRGVDQGVSRGRRHGPSVLRARLGEEQLRASRFGGGRHRVHQGGARAASRQDSADAAFPRAESAVEAAGEPVLRERGSARLAAWRSAAARWCQLVRDRRDQRAPGARRSARARAGGGRRCGERAAGVVGEDRDGGARGGDAARGCVRGGCVADAGGRGLHAAGRTSDDVASPRVCLRRPRRGDRAAARARPAARHLGRGGAEQPIDGVPVPGRRHAVRADGTRSAAVRAGVS